MSDSTVSGYRPYAIMLASHESRIHAALRRICAANARPGSVAARSGQTSGTQRQAVRQSLPVKT